MQLIAYYVASDRVKTLEKSQIRNYLKGKLPEYMIPAAFVPLETIPLTPSGKVDRRALLKHELEMLSSQEYVAPRTGTEKQLASIWEEVLAVERVGIHDNFFELGGHSLLATQIISRINRELGVDIPLRTLYETSGIEGLSLEIKESHPYQVAAITSIQRPEQLPLSYAQERLWFLAQLGYSEQYHVPKAVKVIGDLHEEALQKAINFTAARHEILRTGFKAVDGRAIQVITPDVSIGLEKRDLSGLNKEQQEKDCQTIIREFVQRPFELSQAPLVRVILVKLDEDIHIFGICMHHIISDGWSTGILTREISRAYAAYTKGKEPELEKLKTQYADYAVWQREVMTEEELDKEIRYWKTHLAGYMDLDLPTDYPRPRQISGKGGHVKFSLKNEKTRELKKLCQEKQVTLFTAFMTSVYLLMRSCSRQWDICLGMPVANRNHRDIEDLIGFFVNTLVVRINTGEQGDITIRQLLKKVQEEIVTAQDHQDVPFEKVVETIQPTRDLSRTPIFTVMVTDVNTRGEELEFGENQLESVDLDYGTSKFDLTAAFSEKEDGDIGIYIVYSQDLYQEKTIERIGKYLVKIMTHLVEEPGKTIDEIELPGEEEKQKLLIEWNNTAASYPKDQCIHDLFRQQVKKTPENIAVVFEDQELSYWELDERSTGLALYLQIQGIKPDCIVGICLEQSLEMIVGILGILKAGGAYLPIDQAYPGARIRYMLTDSNVRVLLTTANLQVKVKAEVEGNLGQPPGLPLQCINIETDLTSPVKQPLSTSTCRVSPTNLAYVIYTSGSTGKPKGVMVEHSSVINLSQWHIHQFKLSPGDSTTLFASFGFDAAVWELFPYLLNGNTLHLLDDQVKHHPDTLNQYFESNKITIAFLPTQFCEQFFSLNNRSLRILLTGGDQLNRFPKPGVRYTFFNNYGPTENTVVSSCTRIDSTTEKITIGKPVQNTQFYILNENLIAVPIGMPGELHISGAGLARGYLNQAELNQEKFIESPFKPGIKMYKSGDLTRWRPDGNIEFLGRKDHQVKIRGFRIECGEIEAVLANYPKVQDVVVIARSVHNSTQLVAYYVAIDKGQVLEVTETRSYLQAKLPEYMIPAAFVSLEAIPLTPSGKVDRKALLRIEVEPGNSREYIAPRTGTQKQLARIWEEVLGAPRVGIHDNFFELGGHSLLATQIISRINKELEVEVPLGKLFEVPRLESLSRVIEESKPYRVVPLVPFRRTEQLPLSYAQERLWFLARLGYSEQYHVPNVMKIKGDLDEEALQKAINFITARHESLRTGFKTIDSGAIQVIEKTAATGIEQEDLSGLGEEEQDRESQIIIREFVQRPFKLEQAPLMRVLLIKLASDTFIFGMCMHHIVSDGWSMGILTREITRAYAAYKKGKEPGLEPLKVQYADYAVWQRAVMTEAKLNKELTYWKEQLTGYEDLDLPTDYPRPKELSGKGGYVRYRLEKEQVRLLTKLGQEKQMTLFTLLMASVYILLRRYSQQGDICLGMPTANRNHRDIENLVGFFINTLVIRIDTGEKTVITVEQLLNKVQDGLVAAQDQQDMPFEKVVESIQPTRDLSRTPIFQVLVNYVNTGREELQFGDSTLEEVEIDYGLSKFDLTFAFVHQEDNSLGINIKYSQDLYREETIERMGGHLVKIMNNLVKDRGKAIDEIELLSWQEKEKILVQWNKNEMEYPKDKCIHELFWEQVKKTPNQVAVVLKDQKLTYRELDERSTRLALVLQKRGIISDRLVGICLERSLEMIIGILGILKAGGAYVPIDPEYPEERIRYMLINSDVTVLLAQEKMEEKVPGLFSDKTIEVIVLDKQWDKIEKAKGKLKKEVQSFHLAYVIYTSGSTGKPKGVMVQHHGVVNYLNAVKNKYGFAEIDMEAFNFSFLGNFVFDAVATSFLTPLISGGVCILYGQHEDQQDTIRKALNNPQVQVIKLTPSHLQLIRDSMPIQFKSPKFLIIGGESLKKSLVQELVNKNGNNVYCINQYGPTECTIASTAHLYNRDINYRNEVYIGHPIANTRIYILNNINKAVPVGVPGELHIAGDGLARGYLNQPELTAEKFILAHSSWLIADRKAMKGAAKFPMNYQLSAFNCIYKTGDLSRWLPDGNIEFLGRIDHQVKIRGFRIECGEIETVLAQHPKIQETVVIARTINNMTQLVAYYVKIDKDKTLEVSETRSYLQGKLPEYMIPAAFVSLEEIPLTPNGKVDGKALLQIEVGLESSQEYVAPRTKTEKQLTRIWKNVLGVPRVGIHDNFFELGGHSLLATQIISRINRELKVDVPLRKLFDTPRIEDLSRAIAESAPYQMIPIASIRRPEQLPLSYAQERLWFLARLGYSEQYHVPKVVKVIGELDEEALQKAINFIAARHENLRTGFKIVDGRAIQVIAATVDFGIEKKDLSGLSKEEQERDCQTIIREFVQRPFELSQPPLVRVILVKLNTDIHILGICMHHIISDGWSGGILTREISQAYAASRKGKEPGLAPLKVQYADYAVWQREVMTEARLDQELKYWKEHLAGYEDLDLPTDFPRPRQISGKGGHVSLRLQSETAQQLKKLSQKEQITLFTVFMTSVYLLLRRYSRQEDICLGMPVANRNYQEIEDLVGFFANTLVIRIITGESQGITLRRLLKKVQQEIATAQDRQNVPFEKVVETIQPTRDLSRTPIFQVLVNYVNTRREKLQLGESRLEGVEFEYGISKFDLMFAFGDQEDDSLAIAIQYNRDLYREETICRMGGHLVKIIDSLIEEPGKGAEKIELLTEQEKQKLLIDWNHTAAQYPGDQCLHELFRQQVKKTPGKVAVVFADRILTYRELEKRSTGLAKTLQKKGIPPHGLVGVCLERSIEKIVGILGILKAGGAYLPIDPDYPRERIGYILADSNARVLLTTAKLQVKAEVEGNVGRTKGLPIQFINIKADPIPAFEPPDSTLTSTCKVSPTNLAYIIYTSGSTGKPKGVMQTHQTITNLIEFQKRSNPLSPTVQTHVAQFAAHGFDVSIQEIFYTLFNGGVLYILTEETKQSPTEVICFVNRRQINILYLPTAYLEYFSAAVNDHRNIGLKSLERIIVAGEALKIYPSIKNFFTAYTHILLENQYGPSETHVVTRYVLSEDKEQWQYLPPIGHPIANIGIYILSLMNQLVPIGVPGELHIAGDGLARGYLNNPEMTAEKFDHDFLDYQDYQDGYHRSHQKKMPGKKYLPMQSCSHATMQLSPRHSPHYPIYHTGDLARWLPDGNISFLGRIDHQVKVRGFRIECGEIEAELAQHPRVREAVVIARTIGNTVQLIAYYVPVNEDQVIEVSEARNYLQGKLPEYMVPAAFISLQTIPLTANGKVDRKSLLKQELELESRQEYIAPQTETEKQLAGIWKEVLGLEKVGIHDNFFELGGHSLLAIQIISRINKELRINVPLRKLFEAPNIKALSDIAAGCEHTSTEDQITGFVESITEITI
jgi:amino acid adenylation domain-containing protein